MPVRLRERNVIQKDWRKVRLRIALCYPNLYRVGMTSLAIHLLYYLFNARDDIACERVFYVPGEAPRSLESGQPLARFDVVAFSLQFETDYVNAIEMLLRSGIPPMVTERKRPWVVAGGPTVLANPFPMSAFVNVFQLGDIEPVYHQLLDALINAKSQSKLNSMLEDTFLVPGRTKGQRTYLKDLDQAHHPRCQVLPEPPYPRTLEPTFGQSLLVEISRGCDRRCSFCLTGYQCSPRRERQLSTLLELIDEGVRCTQVEKVALLASAFVDHTQLGSLLEAIIARQLQLSVPSLRADLTDPSILNTIYRGGQRTITFAPEAGSEPLREAIGKSIPDEVFLQTFSIAIEEGFNLFKLYFLLGLPTETDDDIRAIHQLVAKLAALAPRRHRLHVSVNPFIPKAHTPFQWFGLTQPKILKKRLKIIRKIQQIGRIILDLPNLRWGVIQAALSRGDAELGPLLLQVAQRDQRGASVWFQVGRQLGIDITQIATTPKSPEQSFPWDSLDVGVKPNILLQRFRRLT